MTLRSLWSWQRPITGWSKTLGEPVNRRRKHSELLAALKALRGICRRRVGKSLPDKFIGARRLSLPGVPAHQAGDLEDDELVGARGEAAEPGELLELGQDLHHRIVGRVLSEIVELRAADRPQLRAPTRQLVVCAAQKDRMQFGNRVIAPRMPVRGCSIHRLDA